jgi:hypothetical protein
VLKASGGWPGLHKVFERPPASTQQIMHPELYLQNVMPVTVTFPPLEKIVPKGFKKLDENLLGEFGLNQIFKQFLGQERADDLAKSWAGDKYAIYERQPGGQTLLLVRVRLASDEDAARFFGGYSEVLEQKDSDRTNLVRRPNFFSFDTPDGGAFLRCYNSECFTAEGTTRTVFDAMTHAMSWPDNPVDPHETDEKPGVVVQQHPSGRTHVRQAALIQILPTASSLPIR